MKKSLPKKQELEALVNLYESRHDEFQLFAKQVASFFTDSRRFQGKPLPLVHSVRMRLKDKEHLREKLRRKWKDGPITPRNLFKKVTDLAGVRVLHVHTQQFEEINNAIQEQISRGYWALNEAPVANSWDPETTSYFRSLGLKAVTRDSYYSSIHYVIKPHKGSDLTCEIQVRTLFEEIWGEIDHALNYPSPTTNLACREQLRVLAKLSSTGTRLADSIFKVVTTSTI